MKRRTRIALVPLIIVGFLAWLFLGIFIEREWGDTHVFLKHRPSLKVIFYSPLGEADRSYVSGKEGYLTPDQEAEESAFVEFVEEGRGYKRSIKVF